MLLRWMLASVHLLGLGIGLGAIWVRARGLRGLPDAGRLRVVLLADAWWGLAAVLWIGTGVWRLFGETEKTTGYYLGNHLFWIKMALFVGILAMEVRPMLTLGRWRRQLASGTTPETAAGPRLARLSQAQAIFVVLMVLAATAMARGQGTR